MSQGDIKSLRKELTPDLLSVRGNVPLKKLKSGTIPLATAWRPSFAENKESDVLTWHFLPKDHPFLRRKALWYGVEGKDGWRVRRDEETGIPTGLAFDDVAAGGYSRIQMGIFFIAQDEGGKGSDHALVVTIHAVKDGTRELSAFMHLWQETKPEDFESALPYYADWTLNRLTSDTGVLEPA